MPMSTCVVHDNVPRSRSPRSACYLSSHMMWSSSSWGPRSLPTPIKKKSVSLCLERVCP